MLKNSTKISLFAILFLLLFSQKCWAGGSLQLTTYYPAPQAVYDRVTLLPQSSLPGTCTIGTIVVEQASGALLYCHDVAGVGTWGYFNTVWSQEGTYAYPALTDSKPLIAVGIGTSTPNFKLTLDNDGGILALGTFGSGIITSYPTSAPLKTKPAQARFIWYPRKAAFRAIWDRWGVADDPQIGNYSVAFGDSSLSAGIASTVSGLWNTASGNYGTIAGGANNQVSGHWSTIPGGSNNTASGQYSVVAGYNNIGSGDHNTISGGLNHTSAGNGQTISGGASNSITSDAAFSTISGGSNNVISHNITAISGDEAFDTSNYSVISGGASNSVVRGGYSTISGGITNTLKGAYAFIGGGLGHNSYAEPTISPAIPRGHYSVIGGGRNNSTQGHWAVVAGGWANTADADYSTISGGRNNRATGTYSVITGGSSNNTAGNYTVIAGGNNNSIGLASYSWVGGRNMNLSDSAQRTFVWGYSDLPVTINIADAFIIAPGIAAGFTAINPKLGINEINPSGILSITLPSGSTSDFFAVTSTNAANPGDIFVVKNDGSVGIGKHNPANPLQFGPQASGAYLDNGGVFHTISSRSFKENIQPLDGQEAAIAVQQLRPVTYNYKIDKAEHHVGFIAEDVPEMVATENRKGLDPMPVTATLTAVLKKQKQDIAEGQIELNMLKEELKTISERMK